MGKCRLHADRFSSSDPVGAMPTPGAPGGFVGPGGLGRATATAAISACLLLDALPGTCPAADDNDAPPPPRRQSVGGVLGPGLVLKVRGSGCGVKRRYVYGGGGGAL